MVLAFGCSAVKCFVIAIQINCTQEPSVNKLHFIN